MTCPKCGKILPDNSKFCGGCGTRLSSASNIDQPKDALYTTDPTEPDNIGLNTAKGKTNRGSSGKASNGKILAAIATGVFALVLLLTVSGVFGSKSDDSSEYDDGYEYENDADADYNEHENGDKQDNGAVAEAPYNQQRIEVVCNGSNGTLSLYTWREGEWVNELTVNAYLGKNGISYNKTEGDRCTPAGKYDLLYYIAIDPMDTALKFVQVESGDVWVCDPDSVSYNTLQSSSSAGDWDKAQTEDLYHKFSNNKSVACIMFSYNGDGLTNNSASYNGGSDIFIDGVGSNGNLTLGYGDIKITAYDMRMLLSYLNSDLHPYINIY